MKNRKLFSKSLLSGALTFAISLVIANFCQFFLFIGLPESIRTDLTVVVTFIISVAINFYLHTNYIFIKAFSISKLFKFAATNILNLITPLIFWFLYELLFGYPSQLIFNFFAIVLTLIIFPLKFFFYKYIFRN